MTSRTLVTLVALSAAACARQAPLPVLLTPQTRLGLGEGFGPGIITATARSMTYRLDRPAHIIVLRVVNDAPIEQVYPSHGGDPALKPGAHSVTVGGPRATYAPAAPAVPSGPVYGPCSILAADLKKADAGCLSHGTAEPPRAQASPSSGGTTSNEAGYWLLIVSDVATPPVQLEARLRGLELDDTSVLAAVRQIPSELVGGRTTNWAAYYVGFSVAVPARVK